MVRLFFLFLVIVAVSSSPSSSFGASRTASFVPPASPPLVTSNPAPTLAVQARHDAVARGYGMTTTALFSNKKKKKSAPAASKKIQVKMLKHVEGTGHQGEVVMVTPAFFQNKLRPQKSAIPISDDEVAAEQSERKAKLDAENAAAQALRERISDLTLKIKRKAGPDGHLFGGVGPKVIMQELRDNVKDDFLGQRQVKITSVTEDGKKLRGDIKHVGDFGVTIALNKEIKAKFDVSVQAEG